MALAGPGTRLGIWDYSTGLDILRTLALPAIVAMIAAGMSFFAALFTARDLAPLTLAATIFVGAMAFVPIKMKSLVEANPFIHDVTTDFENPPSIDAAANLPRKNPPEYLGDNQAPRSNMTVTEAQQAAFPDITTRVVDKSAEEVAQTVRAILKKMNMSTLSDAATDDGWKIEAAYQSMWFGFVDDFIVRIVEEDGGARVDIRSKSRVGGSDLGANAKRVREFLDQFDAAIAAG